MDPQQARGRARREALVEAAVQLWTEEGLAGLTHRRIAQRAGTSLSATTYYFSDLEELLGAAGEAAASGWIRHARSVAERAVAAPVARSEAAALLVEAVLPSGPTEAIGGHYERLVAASRQPALAEGFRRARPELDAVLDDLVASLGLAGRIDPDLLLALVDGAAVAALSEGDDPRQRARRFVAAFLT